MPNDSSIQRVAPPPLPTNPDDWIKKIQHKKSLNDMVDEVFDRLLNNKDIEKREKFVSFLDAVWDEQAIEGARAADNLEAAAMIRQEATDNGPRELAKEKKTTIVKAMNVILRRFDGMSRNERRNMVQGQVLPPPDQQT